MEGSTGAGARDGSDGQKLGKTLETMLCLKDRKGPVSGAFQ